VDSRSEKERCRVSDTLLLRSRRGARAASAVLHVWQRTTVRSTTESSERIGSAWPQREHGAVISDGEWLGDFLSAEVTEKEMSEVNEGLRGRAAAAAAAATAGWAATASEGWGRKGGGWDGHSGAAVDMCVRGMCMTD
jgi:hypothetical protein